MNFNEQWNKFKGDKNAQEPFKEPEQDTEQEANDIEVIEKRKGFALSEVLLSIAVILIISVSSYHLYTSSRDKAEIIQMQNAVTDVIAYVDKFRNTIRENQPLMSALDDLDIMDLVDKSGLSTDYFTLSEEQQSGEGVTKQYDIKGTRFNITSATSTGGFSMVVSSQNDLGGEQCINVAKMLAPEFDREFEVNGVPIQSDGLFATAVHWNLGSIMSACSGETAPTHGIHVDGTTTISGVRTF